MSSSSSVRRLDLGYFLRPADEYGGTVPRAEAVFAYVVRRAEGVLLFDTGIASADPETEAHYRPRRRPLREALSAAGHDSADVASIVNCHLHFDHCGGNPQFPRIPIIVQSAEIAAARAGQYTYEELLDFDGARYEEADGEFELWPDVWVIPTPGHSPGHQSLVVREPDGTVILAGQAHDFASEFAASALAHRALAEGVEPPHPAHPAWLDRVLEFDPSRVVFAHDASVWTP